VKMKTLKADEAANAIEKILGNFFSVSVSSNERGARRVEIFAKELNDYIEIESDSQYTGLTISVKAPPKKVKRWQGFLQVPVKNGTAEIAITKVHESEAEALPDTFVVAPGTGQKVVVREVEVDEVES